LLVGGLQEDFQVQKTTRIGRTNMRAKSTNVFTPPFSKRVRRPGIPIRALASRRLEKLSFPAPSAGRGPL
jgi:hypothetical protein